MATANEEIADGATTHALSILRVAADLRNQAFAELLKLEAALAARVATLPEGMTPRNRDRLLKLFAQTQKTIANTYKVLAKNNGKGLVDIATAEQTKQNAIINNTFAVDVMTVAQTPKQLEAMVSGQLMHGKFQHEWWKKQGADLQDKFSNVMRIGMAQGDGIDAMVRRVRGTKANGYADGIMDIPRRQAEALVRTSAMSVANEARIRSFLANTDVIKAIQWRSTLDGRTTPICIGLDGLQWSLPNFIPIAHKFPFPGPVAHWNCRSTQVAVTRSFDELGSKKISPPDLPDQEYEKLLRKGLKARGMSDVQIEAAVKAKRPILDGKAVPPETFDDFLRRKGVDFQNRVLGPQRAQLWREGKITRTDLIGKDLRPLTVKQLQKMVDEQQVLPPSPIAIEGQNGLAIVERRLLEESMLQGKDAKTLSHFVDLDTGLRHSYYGSLPSPDDLDRAAQMNKVSVLRNGAGSGSVWTTQELAQFGTMPNFKGARMVLPDGRVLAITVKAGNTFGATEAKALNAKIASLKNTYVSREAQLIAAVRTQGVLSVRAAPKASIDVTGRTATTGFITNLPEPNTPVGVRSSYAVIAKVADQTAPNLARALMANAELAKPATLRAMNEIATKLGGKIEGEIFAVKGESSLIRKIRDDAREQSVTHAAAAARVGDTLRFTMLFDPKDYTTQSMLALERLEQAGYKVEKLKNTWLNATYRGVNVNLRAPSGIIVELQFHTAQSIDIKEKKAHEIYELNRVERDPRKKEGYQNQQVKFWSGVEIPPGAETVRPPNTPVNSQAHITVSNVFEYKANVDASKLAKHRDLLAGAFTMDTPGLQVVDIGLLISPKNELLDPKYILTASRRLDPRQSASNYMVGAIERGEQKRLPLAVIANPDGTFTIADGNATAQAAMLAGWTKLPVVVVKSNPVSPPDPLATALREVEPYIYSNLNESAHVFDRNGKLLFAKQGNSDQVLFTPDETEQMYDTIVTHNHPTGGPLSEPDVNIFLRTGMAEMRAVGQNAAGDINLYRLRKKQYTATPVNEYIDFLFNTRVKMGTEAALTQRWQQGDAAERARIISEIDEKAWAEIMDRFPELLHERIEFNP